MRVCCKYEKLVWKSVQIVCNKNLKNWLLMSHLAGVLYSSIWGFCKICTVCTVSFVYNVYCLYSVQHSVGTLICTYIQFVQYLTLCMLCILACFLSKFFTYKVPQRASLFPLFFPSFPLIFPLFPLFFPLSPAYRRSPGWLFPLFLWVDFFSLTKFCELGWIVNIYP